MIELVNIFVKSLVRLVNSLGVRERSVVVCILVGYVMGVMSGVLTCVFVIVYQAK